MNRFDFSFQESNLFPIDLMFCCIFNKIHLLQVIGQMILVYGLKILIYVMNYYSMKNGINEMVFFGCHLSHLLDISNVLIFVN
jgi:hypothetical protein